MRDAKGGDRLERRALLFRLIGRLQAERLENLAAQIGATPHATLDLLEVTIIDLEVVRFLLVCERNGTTLSSCLAYIREWI